MRLIRHDPFRVRELLTIDQEQVRRDGEISAGYLTSKLRLINSIKEKINIQYYSTGMAVKSIRLGCSLPDPKPDGSSI